MRVREIEKQQTNKLIFHITGYTMEKEQEEMTQKQDAAVSADGSEALADQEMEAATDPKEEMESGDDTADTEDIDDRDPITVAKENFYDRLPFTYRQVDIFCKVLIGVLIAIFVYYAVLK